MEEIMGRYYHGDIEGKFWFAVQSSNDADFFGVEGEPAYLNYYFNDQDKDKVHEGIVKLDKSLGRYKKLLDEFFESREGYNNEQLTKFLDEKNHPHCHSEEEVKVYLKLYARRYLGKKIYDCINENGECGFEAEL